MNFLGEDPNTNIEGGSVDFESGEIDTLIVDTELEIKGNLRLPNINDTEAQIISTQTIANDNLIRLNDLGPIVSNLVLTYLDKSNNLSDLNNFGIARSNLEIPDFVKESGNPQGDNSYPVNTIYINSDDDTIWVCLDNTGNWAQIDNTALQTQVNTNDTRISNNNLGVNNNLSHITTNTTNISTNTTNINTNTTNIATNSADIATLQNVSLGNAVLQTPDTYTQDLDIGSIDEKSVSITTNNIERLKIDKNGKIKINNQTYSVSPNFETIEQIEEIVSGGGFSASSGDEKGMEVKITSTGLTTDFIISSINVVIQNTSNFTYKTRLYSGQGINPANLLYESEEQQQNILHTPALKVKFPLYTPQTSDINSLLMGVNTSYTVSILIVNTVNQIDFPINDNYEFTPTNTSPLADYSTASNSPIMRDITIHSVEASSILHFGGISEEYYMGETQNGDFIISHTLPEKTITPIKIDKDNNVFINSTKFPATDVGSDGKLLRINEGDKELEYVDITASDIADLDTAIDANANVVNSINHIADDTKHRVIDDGQTTATNLWSADKINTEINNQVGGITYDQSLNTTDTVVFNQLTVGDTNATQISFDPLKRSFGTTLSNTNFKADGAVDEIALTLEQVADSQEFNMNTFGFVGIATDNTVYEPLPGGTTWAWYSGSFGGSVVTPIINGDEITCPADTNYNAARGDLIMKTANVNNTEAKSFKILIQDNGAGGECDNPMLGLFWSPSGNFTTAGGGSWDRNGSDQDYFCGLYNNGAGAYGIIYKGTTLITQTGLDPIADFASGDEIEVIIETDNRIHFKINGTDITASGSTYYIQGNGSFLTNTVYPLLSDISFAENGYSYHATIIQPSGGNIIETNASEMIVYQSDGKTYDKGVEATGFPTFVSTDKIKVVLSGSNISFEKNDVDIGVSYNIPAGALYYVVGSTSGIWNIDTVEQPIGISYDVNGHIGDDTKHRTINDAGTSATELWSSNKIDTEIKNITYNQSLNTSDNITTNDLKINGDLKTRGKIINLSYDSTDAAPQNRGLQYRFDDVGTAKYGGLVRKTINTETEKWHLYNDITTQIGDITNVSAAIGANYDNLALKTLYTDGADAILPNTDNIGNMGSSSKRFNDGHYNRVLAPIIEDTTEVKTKINGTDKLTVGNLQTTITTDLNVNGNMECQNLNVLGTTTTIDSTEVKVADSAIHLGVGNMADLLDMGFYGCYNNGNMNCAGLMRDASDSRFYLFKDYDMTTNGMLTNATDLSTLPAAPLNTGELYSYGIVPRSASTYNIGNLTDRFDNSYFNTVYSSNINNDSDVVILPNNVETVRVSDSSGVDFTLGSNKFKVDTIVQDTKTNAFCTVSHNTTSATTVSMTSGIPMILSMAGSNIYTPSDAAHFTFPGTFSHEIQFNIPGQYRIDCSVSVQGDSKDQTGFVQLLQNNNAINRTRTFWATKDDEVCVCPTFSAVVAINTNDTINVSMFPTSSGDISLRSMHLSCFRLNQNK